jgi:flagellar protein FliJ
MKHQRHFESENALREAAQIRTLIADLDHIVRILNCEIATEEERAGVSDRSQPEYPMTARTLSARRDNLENTIASLEQRLTSIRALALPTIPAALV